MLFFIDLDSLELVKAASDRSRVSQVDLKRGDSALFELVFVRSGIVQQLTDGNVITFGAKERKKYDSTPVILHDDFDLTGSGDTAKYLGTPSLNTEPLNNLLLIDGVTTNDLEYIDLMAEFSWKIGEGAPTSTRTFVLRVNNDVIRDDDGTPAQLPDPDAWTPGPLALTAPPVDGVAAVPGVFQSSTLDFASPFDVLNNGNVWIAIESSFYTGHIEFAVLGSDTGAQVAAKARAACAAASGTTFLTASGTGSLLTLTRTTQAANDATMAVTVEPGNIPLAAMLNPPAETKVAGSEGANEVAGTAGTRGQLAIVTTTQSGRIYRDPWTCTRTTLPVWTPPGNIFRDQMTGTLIRQIFSAGSPDYIPAYP